MLIRRTARPLTALGLVALVALATGAHAATPVVSDLAVDTDYGVTVTGLVHFDALAAPLTQSAGTDAAGDAQLPGGDLTGATITVNPTVQTATFTLSFANGLPDQASALPVFVWPLAVDGNDVGYGLQGGRAGLSGITPRTNPVFLLTQDGPDGFLTVGEVEGTLTSKAISWTLPLSMIGAQGGSTISVGSAFRGAIEADPGATGIVVAYTGSDQLGTVTDVTLPNGIKAGIAPAGKVVKATTPAVVDYDGIFSAVLPMPSQPGQYDVAVKACGVGTDCTTQTVRVTL